MDDVIQPLTGASKWEPTMGDVTVHLLCTVSAKTPNIKKKVEPFFHLFSVLLYAIHVILSFVTAER